MTAQVPFLLLGTPQKPSQINPCPPTSKSIQPWGNFLLLPGVSTEQSAAAAPKAAKDHEQELVKFQSLGAAGDVEFWGRTYSCTEVWPSTLFLSWIIRKLLLCPPVLGLILDPFTSSSSEPNQLNPFTPCPSFCSTSKWSLTFIKSLQMLVPGSLGLLQCSCQLCCLSNPKRAALLVQQVPLFTNFPSFTWTNTSNPTHSTSSKATK